MDIQDWSATAASNTDVDGIDISEGCDPANINNAIRAVMANIAAFRDLFGGAKVSAGSADAQTLTTGLSLVAYGQGLMLAFEAGSGLTNTGAMTMNVDAIGAKSVKLVGGANPPAGAVTAGGIYLLAYEAGADALLLLNPTPDSGLANLVEDATPQLGGDLDLNGHALDFPSTANIADVLDEDNMASDSATALATQQSIKAYADTRLALAGGTLSGEVNLADNLLTRPKIKDYGEAVNALGSGGGTRTVDLTLGNVVTATVSTSTNTFAFTNPSASGVACSFTLILTNGGSQTVNWPAAVDWAGGAAPTLTTSGVDVLTFVTTDGGTTWFGFAAGLDMS